MVMPPIPPIASSRKEDQTPYTFWWSSSLFIHELPIYRSTLSRRSSGGAGVRFPLEHDRSKFLYDRVTEAGKKVIGELIEVHLQPVIRIGAYGTAF
jgi:hypothetical protein